MDPLPTEHRATRDATTRRLQIAFVTQPFGPLDLPPGGSIEIWSMEVAKRLAPTHDVVVYGRRGPEHPTAERVDDVDVRRFRLASSDRNVQRVLRRLARVAKLLPDRLPAFALPTHFATYAAQVAVDARRRGCDVVHIHNFAQLAPIVRRLNPHARIALHMHCGWLDELDAGLVRRRLGAIDDVFACSHALTEAHRRRFPDVQARFTTLRNGVDVDLFMPRPRGSLPRKLLTVGRLTPEKGLHVLIDAFARIADRHPDVMLEMVGPPWQTPEEFIVRLGTRTGTDGIRRLRRFYDGRPYHEHVASLVPERLRDRVRIRAELVGHDELAASYANAEVFVNPSLSEAFGMSIVEAGASGIPVVATRVGGVPEAVVDGVTGRLVPSDDPEALADALHELLEDPVRGARMGRAARQRIERELSWEAVATHLEALLADGTGSAR
jgi:glycosyltransferase involved in cell wall biosynthesis